MRLTAALLAALLAAAGCGSAAGPSPSPGPLAGLWLRATLSQALPPVGRFGWLPAVAIIHDRVVVTSGPIPAIFPGPLLPPLIGRRISEAGLAKIVAGARDHGLLSGQTDFTGGAAPGQLLARIELATAGGTVVLVGDPERVIVCIRFPCEAPPGTPEAFGSFWQELQNLSAWLGEELGPEAPWEAEAYALLVGPAPDPQGLPQPPADWPLAARLATLGAPTGDGAHRCVTVRGDDAVRLRPALQAATQTTAWTQDPDTSATFGLTVRPLLPGEDACRELFGVGA